MTMDSFRAGLLGKRSLLGWGPSPNGSGNQGSANPNTAVVARPAQATRRNISPTNGRALEILGHAIEYLTDEYALSAAHSGTLESGEPRIEAIQILMTVNRQIYYACPKIEPVFRRIARLIFRTPALPATDVPSKQRSS